MSSSLRGRIALAALAFSALAPIPAFAQTPLPDFQADYFTGSGVCVMCHTQLKDSTGKDVSIDTAWRATMMGNAARDPFWRMVLRGELIANPQLRTVIEDKCSTCHMPMARTTAATDKKPVGILDDGFANPKHELNLMALDSVSCTLCHQITPDKLGSKESYTGHYTIGSVKNKIAGGEKGQPEIYGQYTPTEKAEEMTGGSGFAPKRSPHIQDSALCGSCHNLYTPFVKTNGEMGEGEVAEQAPYTEWENSAFFGQKSCQQCHMPTADGKVALSVSGGDPHHGFKQHYFVGGNYYMLEILRKYGQEIGTPGAPEDFAKNIALTIDYLGQETAAVAIKEPAIAMDGSQVTFDVEVRNGAGHKFPTAYPARRAWLHTSVIDRFGNVAFESGASRPDGSIVGNDEDTLPNAYEPHYSLITSPKQVQIYQAGLGDSDGVPTTTLLKSAKYLKDNRLLPLGFDKDKAPHDVQVFGDAKQDARFVAGGHTVSYKVDVRQFHAPFTVETELLYQPMNYRWVKNLANVHAQTPNAEAETFLRYYRETPNLPARVAWAAMTPQLRNPASVFIAPPVKAEEPAKDAGTKVEPAKKEEPAKK